MRISRYKRKVVQGPVIRFNEGIRVPQLRVIDENGVHLEVMSTADALAMARERELDLVMVNPNIDPPVAKFADYGQYKYQKEKELRRQKAHAKKVEVKGVRLSLRIGEHDIEVRRTMAQRFMEEGNRVRVELILRGRERQHADLAKKIVEDFVGLFPEIRVDQPFQKQGGVLSMVIAKK